MSGVATLKARGVKRPIDEMAIDVAAPASCSPARFALRPNPISFKRSRFSPTPASSSRNSPLRTAAVMAAVAVAGNSSSPPASSPLMIPPSVGTASSKVERLSADEIAALARHVPKRLKKVVARYAAGTVAPGEKLFTAADLREIVTSVCAEREEKMGEDFQKLLQEKMSEQFRQFTRFNEDFISRKMRDRDCSYLS